MTPSLSSPHAIQTVTVYAGSGANVAEHFREDAFLLGKLIAEQGWQQVNGGGSTGMMGAATAGALSAGGTVDAVILRRFVEANAHAQVRSRVVADTMAERKRGLHERGDALVALPGGLGTLDELAEMCCARQLSMHEKPVVVVNSAGFFDGLRQFLRHAVEQKFVTDSMLDAIYFADTPQQAINYLTSYKPVPIDKSTVNSGEMTSTPNVE